MRYTLDRAAELAEASYAGKAAEVIAWQWSDTLDQDDVMAHLLTDDTLLIVGSNSWRDYVRFNLRIQRLGAPRMRLANVNVPVTWHQGFLAYTKGVQDWIQERVSPRVSSLAIRSGPQRRKSSPLAGTSPRLPSPPRARAARKTPKRWLRDASA